MPPAGRAETNKKQPAIRLPHRILAHIRRWHRMGAKYAVEWRGRPIKLQQHGFATIVRVRRYGYRMSKECLGARPRKDAAPRRL
jgi:hypothetical protein